MEWQDDALVLRSRAQGENNTVTKLFTRTKGAVSAVVHGGQGSRKGPLLQSGNLIQVEWRGKREDDLGRFEIELHTPHAASALSSRIGILGLNSMIELMDRTLPDQQPYEALFEATDAVLAHAAEPEIFPILLVKWEIGLLSALGYGLTLDRCAASGRLLEDGADLVFVSPKSGCAVSQEAGLPYKERLLPLPPFLIAQGEPLWPDVIRAYEMTGHFLQNSLLTNDGGMLPEAREQMIRRMKAKK